MKMIIKIIFSLFILSITYFAASAQSKYGNEWIDPSKTYFKLKTAQNGIYKVTFEELIAAGFAENTIIGSSLKLLNFGEERAIYVSDNDFGPGDYIEFYGEKNTIGLDSLLYNDWSKDLFNPEYSLVTDTNAYFLTLSPESSNLRYTLVNPDFENNTLMPFPFYLHDEKIVSSGSYFKNVDGDIRYSQFEPSEGFGDALQQISTTVLNTSQLVDSGPTPVLRFRSGQNSHLSKLEISWNSQIKATPFINPKLTSQFFYELEKSEVKGSNNLVLKNINSANDRHRLAFVSLVYPRAFDFGGTTQYNFLLPSSATKRYLQISSFKTENSAVFLYDIKNQIRYTTRANDGKVQAIVNSVSADTKYLLINSETGVKKVNSISKFIPKKFADTGQEYVIISNNKLYGSGQNYVQEYADYRSSEAGGNYQTEIIEIQDIYDHFAYGIDRHFMGIKHLAGYMKNNWQEMKFVLILGKGIEYPYMRTNNDVINNENLVFFVPTFGYVGSDNMLFSDKNFPDPYFAIGRVAARTPEDIKNYLDKVKQYDLARLAPQTVEDKYWMKRVLHLGGGKNDFEQNAIKSGLNGMATILSDTIYGADIRSYFKSSTDAVQFSVNEELTELFESGIGIVNFFGHSASGSWDFSIQNPRDYDNFGKFPLINSFGCYAGNLHGVSKGISESFVLEKNRGAIGFFASTGTAFISSLSNYGRIFYNTLTNDLRYQSIGEAIQFVANKNRNVQFAELALYSQLTYHGDPALSIYLEKGPDYLFNSKTAKTSPATIQAALQDFKIELDIANIGTYIKDSVDLYFFHELPGGKIADTIYYKLSGIANTEKISITLKNYGNVSVGKNRLLGIIDPKNVIAELPSSSAENNNDLYTNSQIGFDFYVTDNYATVIYPPDFAMINTKDHFVLKASTSSVPVSKGNYIFQIDTTAYFNSPLIETAMVESEGGIIVYTPKQAPVAERVYYWRISPDSLSSDGGYKWSGASFAYMPDEDEGWNQSHFFQFAQNEFLDLEISEETGRRFEFGKEYYNILLKNSIWNPSDRPGYTRNNVLLAKSFIWDYLDAGIGIVINNDIDFSFEFNPPGGISGSYNPTNTDYIVHGFKTNSPEERKKAMDFIENKIIQGKYLNFFTVQKKIESNYHPDLWAADSLIYGKSLFTVLEKLGATKIRQLEKKGSVPYLIQLYNGKEGVYAELIADDVTDVVQNVATMHFKKQIGGTKAVELNKLSKVKTIKYNISENSGSGKSLTINVESKSTGEDFKISQTNVTSGTSIQEVDKDFVIRLASENYDSLLRRSPQLNFWRISYDPLPDAAISFVKTEPSVKDNEVKQGEKIRIFYDVINVNYTGMDSILVKYTYIGSDNQSASVYKKLGKLGAGQKISDFFEFTIGAGNLSNVRLVIEINPDNNQPELHKFNNTLTKQLGVNRDQTNPLLDVFFDGIRIMDGDIVSPKPEILVTLEDDNTFLPVTDPNLFEMKLDTGRNQIIQIPMDNPQIKFTPAGQGNTTAKILYYPVLKEGEYKLIVQAKDASGNKSGINPRSINFKVIEKQSVSNVLNYPNPFSTSTQFVFTLTGEEIPDIMSISIMTISGKVVKEITKEELGPLHIGTNRTEYKWDGTDDFGSKLANGVYLYKVNIRKKSGDIYDQYTITKADVFFKEGFGKMVILR